MGHGGGGDHRGEVEVPAHREVDLSQGEEEHGGERDHPEERVARDQVEQVLRLHEGAVVRADHNDEQEESGKHSELLGDPEAWSPEA